MKSHKIILAGLILFGAAFTGAVLLSREVTQTKQIITGVLTQAQRNNLVEAFSGSYPENLENSEEIVEIDLEASEGIVKAIDDRELQGFSYNGQIPGPEIRLQLGQRLKINFTNNLNQSTTIHFHGIRVPNAMDGVPGVTQEPIQPGDSFTYEFTPKDAGTFWFHPHIRGSEQLEKGLYGTIIVENPEESGFSKDLVWVIDDWRLDESGQISPYFNTMHDLMHDGRWGSTVTVNGRTDQELKLNPGEHIRLRIVNTSNARDYRLDFGQLTAKIIAVDGMPVAQTFEADGFDLAPGNRVDVDVTASEDMVGKTTRISDTFGRITVPLALVEVGQSVTEVNPTYFLADVFPDWSTALDSNPDYNYELDAVRGGMYGISWSINGEIYPNIEPTTLKAGNFYKLRITNKSGRLHPMHLHGQFFQVLAIDGQPANQKYWRDTVLVYPNQTVDLSLVPMDPGNWAYHCHAQEHAEAGMMTLIEVE